MCLCPSPIRPCVELMGWAWADLVVRREDSGSQEFHPSMTHSKSALEWRYLLPNVSAQANEAWFGRHLAVGGAHEAGDAELRGQLKRRVEPRHHLLKTRKGAGEGWGAKTGAAELRRWVCVCFARERKREAGVLAEGTNGTVEPNTGGGGGEEEQGRLAGGDGAAPWWRGRRHCRGGRGGRSRPCWR